MPAPSGALNALCGSRLPTAAALRPAIAPPHIALRRCKAHLIPAYIQSTKSRRHAGRQASSAKADVVDVGQEAPPSTSTAAKPSGEPLAASPGQQHQATPASGAAAPSEAATRMAGDASTSGPTAAAPPAAGAGAGPTEDRRKLWMAAIKPPMYSVGFIPVLVSGGARRGGAGRWGGVGGHTGLANMQ